MGGDTVYGYFIAFCATVKSITPEVLWMTRWHCCTRPKVEGYVHPVFKSTKGVVVLTVAQKGKKYLFYVLPNSELTKGNDMCYANARTARLCGSEV